jgi:hypothetical protein
VPIELLREEEPMKKPTVCLFAMVAALMTSQSVNLFAQEDKSDREKSELPEAAIFWAKGHANHSTRTSSGSPNLIWHGGNIMPNVQVTPIFWGAKWGGNFTGDKMTGLQTFYMGIGFSTYANTTDEYGDANGFVTSNITYTHPVLDLSPAPSSGNRVSPILAEVCKVIKSPSSNGYYPVYVDTPRGNAGFCAWHSAGTCGSTPVQIAFFFNLDGDPGCDPQDTSGLHSEGLAALANVSGHEISEARTDPRLNAWYDSSGQENGDKCAWTFGTPLLTFSNNSQWKIQGNWSNKAYNATTGYANTRGQHGCIDGGNYK